MNRKERVLTAANLSQADRVLMDFQANLGMLQRLHGDPAMMTPLHPSVAAQRASMITPDAENGN